MKIGIITPHFAFNYGAVLQAYALTKYLRNNGYDAWFINRRPKSHCAIPSWYGRIFRKMTVLRKASSFGFFDKTFLKPMTQLIIHENELLNIIDDFDVFMIGSDQVWRDDYVFRSFDYYLFLDFIKSTNKIKVAYAPSLGKPSWNASDDVEAKVKMLLHDFHSISVREDTSVEIMRNKFGVEAELVVDPSLLLLKEDYQEVISAHNNIKKHKSDFLATYILDYNNKSKSVIKSIAKQLNLSIEGINLETPHGRLKAFFERFRKMATVGQWLWNIQNSKFVVTNSFHGMMFSIIFRKQFIVFMNENRGAARFKSLLKMFDLEDRLVDWDSDNWSSVIQAPIDYSRIEKNIEKWRKHSFSYLEKALNKQVK